METLDDELARIRRLLDNPRLPLDIRRSLVSRREDIYTALQAPPNEQLATLRRLERFRRDGLL